MYVSDKFFSKFSKRDQTTNKCVIKTLIFSPLAHQDLICISAAEIVPVIFRGNLFKYQPESREYSLT